MIKKNVIVVATLSLILLASIPVSAQEDNGLDGINFTPALLDLEADPGTEVEFTVNLVNNNEDERTYTLVIQAFGSNDKDGSPLFEEDLQSDMTSWIVLPFDTVTVVGKDSQVLTFNIQVPTTASPGSYQTAVLFREFDSGLREQRSNNAIIGQTGPLIFLNVNGGVSAKGEFTKFQPVEVVSEYLLPDLSAVFSNSGNITLVPKGVINTTLKFGYDEKKSYSMDFNIDKHRTLRDSQREYITSFEQDGKPRIGVYDVELVAAYGKDNKVVTTVTRFIIFPWKLALGILIVIVFITLAILRKRGKTLK